MSSGPVIWTRSRLRRDLERLGIEPGDIVMAHAALRQVGPILGGPDSLISALRDVLGPDGTLMVYTDWNGGDHNIWDKNGSVPDAIKAEIMPFDPDLSRSTRFNGALVELVRTTPGARRSLNAGASCSALGAHAEWLLEDHALDYGYGEHSPFAKLVEAGGKVLMIGAPLDTMTLLHHAEHLADIPGKRVKRYESPFLWDGEVVWRWVEEFDTSDPVVEGLPDDYFATIVDAFLETGGRRGAIGGAASVLVPAADIMQFGVNWLEGRSRG